ncbi:MAG: NUDIX hydrolase [Balneolaceae bacterium]
MSKISENGPIIVEAGGGVVCRNHSGSIQVLLIYRNGVWDLPKGKLEEDESIAECAAREVAEETGIALPVVNDFLTVTRHGYKQKGVEYIKSTHWFMMRPSDKIDSFTPQREEGVTTVKWAKLEVSVNLVGYQNLQQVLKLALQWHKKKGTLEKSAPES